MNAELLKNRVLLVGGTFDDNGGNPSSLVYKLSLELEKIFEVVNYNNGGYYDDLQNIMDNCKNYDIVIWWANVPNDKFKNRNVKEINPNVILITSKRNDDNKYAFAELLNRTLEQKANLCVEFSKNSNNKYTMRLFDPLGNQWFYGEDIYACAKSIAERAVFLCNITRQHCKYVDIEVPEIPSEDEFFEIIKNYAEVFHDLINPAKDVKRFLGNSSFRCIKGGFPSFKKGKYIYVSKRNVDKRYIDKTAFVPTCLENNEVLYWGNNKPSVDI